MLNNMAVSELFDCEPTEDVSMATAGRNGNSAFTDDLTKDFLPFLYSTCLL